MNMKIGTLGEKQFPDEVIDGIIEAAKQLADKTTASAFKGWSEKQILDYWETAQSFMILGADVALKYMERKENNHGI